MEGEVDGEPGPPDTGQFTQTSAFIGGDIDIISREEFSHMELAAPNGGTKRPPTDHAYYNTGRVKQSYIQVCDKMNSLPLANNVETFSSQKRTNNKYKITDSGPYFVIVENKYHTTKLHPMRIGKFLFNSAFQHKDKINIKQLGKSRVKIETNNGIIADHALLNNNELEAYI